MTLPCDLSSQADDLSSGVIPACRHADGTISSSGVPDVRRMVSEDSDQSRSGLSPVHRLGDLSDLDQPLTCQVPTSSDHLDAPCELDEVVLLGRDHRMFCEERDDHVEQVAASSHDEPVQVLTVVVVALVAKHLTDTEEPLELVQGSDVALALCYCELVTHLVAGDVALPRRPFGLTYEAHGEASFSLYETDDPASLDQSFLLIACTHRIVTVATVPAGCDTEGVVTR